MDLIARNREWIREERWLPRTLVAACEVLALSSLLVCFLPLVFGKPMTLGCGPESALWNQILLVNGGVAIVTAICAGGISLMVGLRRGLIALSFATVAAAVAIFTPVFAC